MFWRYFCGRIVVVVLLILFTLLDYCEMSIYPGLRRKPLSQLQPAYEVNSDFLSQLMEENARRRLQQQFEQQLELINMQINRQRQRQERLREERYRHQQQLAALAEVAATYHRRLPTSLSDDPVDTNDYERLNGGNEYIGKMYYNDRQQLDAGEPEIRQRPEYVYPGVVSTKDRYEEEGGNDRVEFAVAPPDPRFYEGIATNQVGGNEETISYDNDNREERRQEVGQKEFIRNDDNSVVDGDGDNDDDDDDQDEDDSDDDLDARVLDEYEEYVPSTKDEKNQLIRMKPNEALALKPSSSSSSILSSSLNTNEQVGGVNYHRIRPPPANIQRIGQNNNSNGSSSNESKINQRQKGFKGAMHQLPSNMFDMDQLDGQGIQTMVAREQLDMKDEMDMYLVALIAGISAAVTVGLLVLGIIWYTFHRRSKEAADVEYPAYGVTGPSKDFTPSDDRKLAQSAQMYHYQHQKQQIMAMESRPNNEDGYENTYIDSDDDNEEGDYTVYECPGLAPTGEMEVKNPLFLDDTPVTPSLGSQTIAQVEAQQPPTKRTVFQKSQKDVKGNQHNQGESNDGNSKSNNNTGHGNGNRNVDPERRVPRKPRK